MPSWDNKPSGSMKAAVLIKPGEDIPPTECFKVTTDYPRPGLPSPDWTLCKVYAAGLNRAELRGRAAFPPGLGKSSLGVVRV